LFGRLCSWNGKPFWELRRHLAEVFAVCTRSITRYFRELVDAGLIVNKPAPLGDTPPGCKKPLLYRPWFKWATGLPQLREAVKSGSREAYERWILSFEQGRQQRATRTKLGEIIGSILSPKPRPMATRIPSDDEIRRARHMTAAEIDAELSTRVPEKPIELPAYTYRPAGEDDSARPRQWTASEIDAELSRTAASKPPDTS
jgi:hypothetical protein